MSKLIIVESPIKAKKIQKFLDKSYIVKATAGHIMQLKGKNKGVDENFNPVYEIISSKRKYINELKKLSKNREIIIASDLDREGERIGESICDVLKLDKKKTKRIIYNKITKKAILDALKNYKYLDQNVLDAQKCRSVLDYLVGFNLSPVLWKNIKNGLSAGRVQSVTTKLIVERHNKINEFEKEGYYDCYGDFNKISCKLNKKLDEGYNILKLFKKSKFKISKINKKEKKVNPSMPYITSTLQQDISIKLGISSKHIMSIAQKLFQNSKITYHRTDSYFLSNNFIDECYLYINKKFGNKYNKKRYFKQKSKNAQEAHEAIRVVNINEMYLDDKFSDIEKKVYNLIWKRSVACQMSSELVMNYKMIIEIDNSDYYFIGNYDEQLFDGFKILYKIKKDNVNKKIKDMIIGSDIKYDFIKTEKNFTKSKGHYSESELIKTLEKLSIGRPSTYASLITTIQNRGYVEKKNKKGENIKVENYILKDSIKKETCIKKIGEEKRKFFPTEMGIKVNEFLNNNFKKIMNYKFTAEIENNLDKIVQNEINWRDVIKSYYDVFNPIVKKLMLNKKTKNIYGKTEKGEDIELVMTKNGSCIKIGKQFYAIDIPFNKLTDEYIKKITSYPKKLGLYNDHEIILNKGKFGKYFKFNGKNYSLKIDKHIDTVIIDDCINIIKNGNKNYVKKIGKYEIKKGKYGLYVCNNKKFYSVKKLDIDSINENDITEHIKNYKRYKSKH